MSLPSIKKNSLNITLSQGSQSFSSEPTLLSVPFTHSWHEQDADEILQLSNVCIDEAIKNLENDGWSKDSVKVIGIYIYTDRKSVV